MANLLLLLLVATAAVTASSIRPALLPRGKAKSVPAFPFDPDTAKYCVWWFDNEDTTPPWTCEEIETLHGVSLQDFVYWVSLGFYTILHWRITKTAESGNWIVITYRPQLTLTPRRTHHSTPRPARCTRINHTAYPPWMNNILAQERAALRYQNQQQSRSFLRAYSRHQLLRRLQSLLSLQISIRSSHQRQ